MKDDKSKRAIVFFIYKSTFSCCRGENQLNDQKSGKLEIILVHVRYDGLEISGTRDRNL